MKKLLLILLCVPLLFSCGANEKDNTDLTRENIKGDVKQIIETSFDAKEAFGEPQKGDLRTKDISKYDEDGNMNENTYYNADGELIWKNNYQYDEDGNRTESTSYNADGELNWNYKYQYEYDKIKNWIVRTEYIDDILESIIEREIEYYE